MILIESKRKKYENIFKDSSDYPIRRFADIGK